MKEKEMRFLLNLQLFAENEDDPENKGNEEDKGLADVIKEQQEKMKNMVDKGDYDTLSEENKKLKDIIINGGALPEEEQEEENLDETIDTLRKQLFTPDNQLSNLEYATGAVKLRKAILKRDGYDVFAPRDGANGTVFSEEDALSAERVAQGLEECIKASDGDSGVFTAKLQGLLGEDSPALRAKFLKNSKRR